MYWSCNTSLRGGGCTFVWGLGAVFLGDSVLDWGESVFEFFFGVFLHVVGFLGEKEFDGSE